MKSGLWREFSAAIFALTMSHIMAPEPARSHEDKVAPIAAHNHPEIFKNVGIEQKLGTQLPLETTFRDQTGTSVSLQGYLSEKPAVLVFSYFDCPMLCPLVLEGLVRSLKPLSLGVGRDFDIFVPLTVRKPCANTLSGCLKPAPSSTAGQNSVWKYTMSLPMK